MRGIFLLFVVVIACQPRPDATFVRLRVALSGTFEPLSPTGFNSQTGVAQNLVYEPLAHLDESGHLVPGLATRLTRIDDRHFRAVIREGVTFSDGAELSKQDLADSLANSGLKATADGDSLIVEPVQPGIPVEPLLGRVLVFHRAGKRILGSGPFAVSVEDADHVVLTRRVPLPRHVDELSLLRFATRKDAFVHTLKGDADVLLDVEPRWLEFFENVPRLRTVRVAGIKTDAVAFNSLLPREKRLRLARILASDAVRRAAFGTACPPLGRPRVEASGSEKLSLISFTPYDRFALAARRALGTGAGKLTLTDNVRQYFAEIGKYDLAVARLLIWPPGQLAISFHSKSPANELHYSNPEVDAAFAAGDWNRAENLLAEDPPAAMVCVREQVAVVDSRIRNPTFGRYDALEQLPEWEIDE